MIAKVAERNRALALRKQGKTYREILKEIPVAKSTLSLWLRNADLSKRQTQKLTAKKHAAQLRGGARKREIRLQETERIVNEAKKEIGTLDKRDLFLVGAALYWAEGSKEKEWRTGCPVQFANSDPEMITFFLYWLEQICGVSRDQVRLSLYIHENHKSRINEVKKFWFKKSGFRLSYVYFKKHNVKTRRNNTRDNYHGMISVNVRASTALNRKIAGWIRGIVGDNCRIV